MFVFSLLTKHLGFCQEKKYLKDCQSMLALRGIKKQPVLIIGLTEGEQERGGVNWRASSSGWLPDQSTNEWDVFMGPAPPPPPPDSSCFMPTPAIMSTSLPERWCSAGGTGSTILSKEKHQRHCNKTGESRDLLCETKKVLLQQATTLKRPPVRGRCMPMGTIRDIWLDKSYELSLFKLSM